jgi:molybdenum cofactor sulfurtransferase
LTHLNQSYLDNYQLHGHKCGDHIDLIENKPTGCIRASFGYCTIKEDINRFIEFLRINFQENEKRKKPEFELLDESLRLDLNKRKGLIENKVFSQNKQYFKIEYLFIYPIKSCAPMKIEDKWPINTLKNKVSGFMFDRQWIIVDENYVPLTQKRLPVLTELRPLIDLDRNVLSLSFRQDSFCLSLDECFKNKANAAKLQVQNANGYDEGDTVSAWLTKIFDLRSKCRLFRMAQELDELTQANGNLNDTLSNVKSGKTENSSKSAFVNKADYLLINIVSVQKLRKFLVTRLSESNQLFEDYSKEELKTIKKSLDYYLVLQFRPNIVISTFQNQITNEETQSTEVDPTFKFDEEFWLEIKILNKPLAFEIVENCNRCQMINISQNSIKLEDDFTLKNFNFNQFSSMLLKELYRMKSNSKFGIYLQRKDNDENIFDKANLNESIKGSLGKEILSIGDIGMATFCNILITKDNRNQIVD